jgi:hypothetical protein
VIGMIAYRDFEPKPRAGLFPKAADLKLAFDAAVALANEWIDGESIEVINVETVGMGEVSPMQRSVRIWYRARF